MTRVLYFAATPLMTRMLYCSHTTDQHIVLPDSAPHLEHEEVAGLDQDVVLLQPAVVLLPPHRPVIQLVLRRSDRWEVGEWSVRGRQGTSAAIFGGDSAAMRTPADRSLGNQCSMGNRCSFGNQCSAHSRSRPHLTLRCDCSPPALCQAHPLQH